MIPQHREEPLYQRELFRLASADCLRPGGVELTERGLAHCAFGGERVADLGCGPGVTLALLAERGLSPMGMDRSAAMLQEAERRLSGVPLLAGTLEGLPFRDACMDGIVCECVLSLSYTPERALGEMGRVLRPGGRLLLTDIVVREGSHGAGGQAVRAVPCLLTLWRNGWRGRDFGFWPRRIIPDCSVNWRAGSCFRGFPVRRCSRGWEHVRGAAIRRVRENGSGIGCSSRKRGTNERIDVGTHTSDSGRILLQPAPRPARLAAAGCGKSRVGQGRWRALSRNGAKRRCVRAFDGRRGGARVSGVQRGRG